MSLFDWRSGRFLSHPPKSRSPEEGSDASSAKSKFVPVGFPRNKQTTVVLHSDSSSNPFQRRTNPPDAIRPVIIRSHPTCKRADVKNVALEPPRQVHFSHHFCYLVCQLFWVKRLADHVAIDSETNEACKPLSLPRGVQCKFSLHLRCILSSSCRCSRLSVSTADTQFVVRPCDENQPYRWTRASSVSHREESMHSGEYSTAHDQGKFCFLPSSSSFVKQTYIVSEDDIRRQEMRVKELRRKLQVARKRLHPVS